MSDDTSNQSNESTQSTPPIKNELPENWYEVLPPEMQSNGVVKTAKSLESLAKMAIDGRKLAAQAIRIPSEDADEQTRKAFFDDLMEKVPELTFKPKEDDPEQFLSFMRNLGAPESPDGYDVPEVPETIKGNIDKLREKAAETGLTKAQFKTLTETILADYKESADANLGQMEQNKEALKSEWGNAFDAKLARIAHFAEQTGFSNEFAQAISEGRVPASDVKAFDRLIDNFKGEGVNVGQQPNDPMGMMTPSEAESRVNEIMSNKKHAYWNPADPEHKNAVDKVLKLVEIAESGKSSAA